MLAIMSGGKSGATCGACRGLMVQLMPNSYQEIEVRMDFEAAFGVSEKILMKMICSRDGY